MPIEQFIDLCEKDDLSQDDFAKIISSLRIIGMENVDAAKRFEVAPSTISRWSKGTAKPLKGIQKFIAKDLAKKAKRIVNSQSKAEAATQARIDSTEVQPVAQRVLAAASG